MKKYYETKMDSEEQKSTTLTRTRRNQELYQDISKRNLDNINIESNAHVIGDNDSNIDINKIKELLEKKYRSDEPRKALIREELPEEEPINEEITKEYNINSLLAKAKKNQTEDYERERLKKIRDTQYDILKNLDVEDSKPKEDKNLMNLINTINEKETIKDVDPLDILTDLKGSENTVVLDGAKNEINRDEIKETVKEEVKKEIDKSFYTNSLSFTQSDFDDFNDLKEDLESNKLLVKVLLGVVVIALIAGIVFLINHIWSLGWF